MKLDFHKKKIIFYIVVIISFLAILIYNFLTPLMSDDLLFNLYHSTENYTLSDLIKLEYENYLTWNGRIIPQFIMHCCLLIPKWLFNILNSACFVLLTFLIYWNIRGKNQYDFVILALINLMIWQFGVSFDQTILWLSGACNYLWGAVIILGFVTYFRYKVEHIDAIKHGKLLGIGLFIFGITAGWCNENTSGGGFLLIISIILTYYFSHKQIKVWMITGTVGMLSGLLLMVLAPGNSVRADIRLEQENHTGLLGFVGRFLKINIAVNKYLFPMMIIIIILLVYLVLKGKNLKDFTDVLVLMAVSMATSYVLIMTTPPMDRAYFGAGIFMTIAFIQMVAAIPKDDLCLNTLKYAGVIIFTIFMYFSYFENGADLMRILREVNERNDYIEEQIAQGNLEITVPQIRPQFETKYSFIYLNDVEEDDPSAWGNWLYQVYNSLDSVVGVPRDEWTEY